MPLLPASVTRSAWKFTTSSSARIVSFPRPVAAIRSNPLATTLSGISLPFALFSSSSKAKDEMGTAGAAAPTTVQKSESEWQAILSPEQFRVIRQKGTERPGSHKYDHSFDKGVYHCAACDAPLYTSNTKFDSGCGWPAFFDTVPGAVVRHEDRGLFSTRTEICCAKCGGHLGHVFKGEGFGNPTDERHCVNGISLNFKDEQK